MALSEKYQQASYRGIEFYIKSETTKGGKKFVVHEYPNSKRRYLEELGVNPSEYSIRGLVHGDSALTAKLNLENAFKESGLGVLVHPLYGRVDVKAGDWEFSSEETNIGEISFSVTFYESEANITLEPSLSGSALVTSYADTARSLGYAAIKANMQINKAQEALQTTQLIATTIMDVAAGKVKSLSDLDPAALSAFDRVFGTATREVYEAATSAESLGDSFSTFYESLRGVTDPASQKEMWRDLTSYELDREQGSTSTVIRAANENNTNVMNSHTRINALVNLFESTAYTTFNTATELASAKKELDEKFESLLGSVEYNPLAEDKDLRDAIHNLRTVTNSTLDELAENTFNIIQVAPGETSLPLLTYFYYGSLDNEDTIRELNPGLNSANIEVDDTVEVVS